MENNAVMRKFNKSNKKGFRPVKQGRKPVYPPWYHLTSRCIHTHQALIGCNGPSRFYLLGKTAVGYNISGATFPILLQKTSSRGFPL